MKRKSETMNQQAATQTRYDVTAKNWAVALLSSGVAPVEVARTTGINQNYVRTLKARISIKREVVSASEAVAIQPVSNGETNAAAPATKVETSRFMPSTLDIVFYTTTLTACAGFVTAFHWWGLPVSLVYSLILVDAMGMAKDVRLQTTAERGSAAVIVLEIIAGFAHTYVFNLAMWANYKSLPFEIEQVVRAGEITWHNGNRPFFVAVCIAAILSSSAIYAVDTTIKKTRERTKKSEI